MKRRPFEKLVYQALNGLPAAIQPLLQKVSIVVQQWPTAEQLKANGLSDRYELLGLYEGTPLIDRDSSYNMVLPDKITIFRGPLEALCDSSESLRQEVRKTVVHELAHHLGINDEELIGLGY